MIDLFHNSADRVT